MAFLCVASCQPTWSISGCYGVTESGSVSSTMSSCSTEPWFCEPCQGNVINPPCQLCPNLGKFPLSALFKRNSKISLSILLLQEGLWRKRILDCGCIWSAPCILPASLSESWTSWLKSPCLKCLTIVGVPKPARSALTRGSVVQESVSAAMLECVDHSSMLPGTVHNLRITS